MLNELYMHSIQRYSIQIRFKERSFMSFLNRIWVAGVFWGNYCVYAREYPYCVSWENKAVSWRAYSVSKRNKEKYEWRRIRSFL